MQSGDTPVARDLVLIGGGHSHLFVLREFAMRPLPGVRLTLVTRDLHTPYSGMLPGFIAGHYGYDDTHIDLLPLATAAGARLIHEPVSGIDADARQIRFEHRPPLAYDLLSINIGSRPTLPENVAAGSKQLAVKPVDRFIESWRGIEQHLRQGRERIRLAIVGGGAGGVELALSLQFRARELETGQGALELCIVTDQARLLPGHNSRVRRAFERILARRGIEVFYRCPVNRFAQGRLGGDFDASIEADYVVWVTHASAAPWLRNSGLALDSRGFVAVGASLQSLSHPDVFAAGDIAAVEEYPRPKSGVFAVRQGLPLAVNLKRCLRGQAPRPYRPQRQFLSLISTGDRYAVASRGPWSLQGRWCWWLKDRIDRRFMRRFTELPSMAPAGESSAAELAPMRCGGCGSKVGSEILERVLARIGETGAGAADSGLQHPDDAARIEPPPGFDLVQSVDFFRSFIDDPWLFGRIVANHALNDLFAMGVEAHSAMVIANVVYASEEKQLQDLYQLMSGVVETLQHNDTRLVGGHSGEAAQMSCGLSVNGFARRAELWVKSGLRAGDVLILTRPLGSGILFAAQMRGLARGAWVDAALAQMLISNRAAMQCLKSRAISACTDITGFGLAGHVHEMARASACAVEIELDRLPLYDGAAQLARAGIESSLAPQNLRIRHAIEDRGKQAARDAYPLLFDPQTAGGLLASLPPAEAEDCVEALRRAGYPGAQIIGRAVPLEESRAPIRLVSF